MLATSRQRINRLRGLLKQPYSSLQRLQVGTLLKTWPDTIERPLILREAKAAKEQWPDYTCKPFELPVGSDALFTHVFYQGLVDLSDVPDVTLKDLLVGDVKITSCKRAPVRGLEEVCGTPYMTYDSDHSRLYLGAPETVYGTVIVLWTEDEPYACPLILSEENYQAYLRRHKLFPLQEDDVHMKRTCPASPCSFHSTGKSFIQEELDNAELAQKIQIAYRDLEGYMAAPFDLKLLEDLNSEVYK